MLSNRKKHAIGVRYAMCGDYDFKEVDKAVKHINADNEEELFNELNKKDLTKHL